MATLSDLAPREMEILQPVLADKANKAIAGEICVCEKTIEFYLDHFYIKNSIQKRLMTLKQEVRK